jgi:hypothetical protein
MEDDEEQMPPVSGRGQHFGEGMLSGSGISGAEISPGLAQMAARYAAQTPTSYRPSGTSNGMGADQFKNTLGGMFPVQNGSASDTYETKKYYGSGS